jgi:hypothetical protein
METYKKDGHKGTGVVLIVEPNANQQYLLGMIFKLMLIFVTNISVTE